MTACVSDLHGQADMSVKTISQFFEMQPQNTAVLLKIWNTEEGVHMEISLVTYVYVSYNLLSPC